MSESKKLNSKELEALARKQFTTPFEVRNGTIVDAKGKEVANMISWNDNFHVNRKTDEMFAKALNDLWEKLRPKVPAYDGHCWKRRGKYPQCTCGPRQCWEDGSRK